MIELIQEPDDDGEFCLSYVGRIPFETSGRRISGLSIPNSTYSGSNGTEIIHSRIKIQS